MAGPLTTPSELATYIATEDVRVLDCRWYLGEPNKGNSEYRIAHLPGAMYVSLDADLSGSGGPGRHPLPPHEAFAVTLAQLGITKSTRVVAYDDRGGAIASRLWWMMTDQGHNEATVLDGGIQGWINSGYRTTTEVPTYAHGDFATREWSEVSDRAAVAARSADSVLIDARSLERYTGEEEPVDPKAGHIPGAVSLPQSENLNTDLTFLSPKALRHRFASIGVVDDTETIAQCGSGVTACHHVLAMEIAGLPRPSLYVGSWSDWSSADLPVAVGESP